MWDVERCSDISTWRTWSHDRLDDMFGQSCANLFLNGTKLWKARRKTDIVLATLILQLSIQTKSVDWVLMEQFVEICDANQTLILLLSFCNCHVASLDVPNHFLESWFRRKRSFDDDVMMDLMRCSHSRVPIHCLMDQTMEMHGAKPALFCNFDVATVTLSFILT